MRKEILIKRLPYVVAILYCIGAVFVWIDFSYTPPDGLANVGIVLYTLPAFLIGKVISAREFPFFVGGYYEAHRVYFIVSVAILSSLMFIVLSVFRKQIERRL